jgi:hypothetical protein
MGERWGSVRPRGLEDRTRQTTPVVREVGERIRDDVRREGGTVRDGVSVADDWGGGGDLGVHVTRARETW